MTDKDKPEDNESSSDNEPNGSEESTKGESGAEEEIPIEIVDQVENLRGQLMNQDEELNLSSTSIYEEHFFKLTSYLRNQIIGLQDYAHSLREKAGTSDLAAACIESQLEEITSIKQDCEKDFEGTLNLKEDPHLNYHGYLISLLSRYCTLIDGIKRLQRVRRTLEKTHDGMGTTYR